MCLFATVRIFKYYEKFGGGEMLYSEEELQKLTEAIDELKDDWTDSVFDADSKLCNEKWMEKVGRKENNWLFNSQLIREKVFEKAEIENRYLTPKNFTTSQAAAMKKSLEGKIMQVL